MLRWRLLLSRPRHSPFLLFPPPVAISIAINIRSYTHSQTRAHGFAYPRTHSHTHPPVLKHNARRRRLNPRWDGDGKLFPCYIKSFSFFRGVQPPPTPHPTPPSHILELRPCLQVNQADPTRCKCFSSVGKSFQDFLPKSDTLTEVKRFLVESLYSKVGSRKYQSLLQRCGCGFPSFRTNGFSHENRKIKTVYKKFLPVSERFILNTIYIYSSLALFCQYPDARLM